ncbi:hypothetical protein [Halostella litorea]|uniref:hypothetical protein n=1 Tax=Halostella litorea TaxID=2528831 RepID=UPI001092CB5B|nr:hypothetical protein [Halostella litorea]
MPPSRRRVLATAGIAVGALSGCLSGDDPEPRAPLVTALVPRNFHDEPHRFELTVSRDGERVHESSHELDGAAERSWTEDSVEGPWGDAPGALDIEVVVDGGEAHEHSYTQETRDCFAFGPTVEADGSYNPWIAVGYECGE